MTDVYIHGRGLKGRYMAIEYHDYQGHGESSYHIWFSDDLDELSRGVAERLLNDSALELRVFGEVKRQSRENINAIMEIVQDQQRKERAIHDAKEYSERQRVRAENAVRKEALDRKLYERLKKRFEP